MFSQAMLVAKALSQHCIVWYCLDSGCRDILTNELLGGIHHPQYHTGIHNPSPRPRREREMSEDLEQTQSIFIKPPHSSFVFVVLPQYKSSSVVARQEIPTTQTQTQHPFFSPWAASSSVASNSKWELFLCSAFSRISTSYFKAHSHQWCIVNFTEIWFIGRRFFLLYRKSFSATRSYWFIQYCWNNWNLGVKVLCWKKF